MTDLAEITAHVRDGMIPAHIYNDDEIFALERDRVFGRAWIFVAHESEIPEPGDYVVRRVLQDSFIITRDEQGTVRAHFNMCLHRGMQVCRAEMGNASHFRCPYHGWSYRNDGRLVGLPFHQDAYGGDAGFRRADQRLLPAPRLDSCNGLIFICLDLQAGELTDYLGDFRFYLDYYTNQSASGIELRGPQRWRIGPTGRSARRTSPATCTTRRRPTPRVVEIGLFREPKAEKRKDGCTYWAGNGGGTTYKLPPGDFDERVRYVGYPQVMVDRMRERLTASQQQLIGADGFMISAATVFPNLSFVHNWPRVGDRDDVLPFISLRQWQPISASETEVLSWFAVDAEAPEEFKALSYKAYLMCFGSTGMFEQDDVENWVSLTSTAAGAMARRLLLNSRMGLLADGREVVPPLAAGAVPRTGRRPRRLRRVQPARPAAPLGRLPRAAARAAVPAGRPGAVDRGEACVTAARPRLPEPGDDTHSSRSPLGGRAPAQQRTGPPLPFGDHATRPRTSGWWTRRTCWTPGPTRTGSTLLADDIHYLMPVRVTTALGAGFDTAPGMAHFDEDKYSLTAPGGPVPDRARLDRGPAVAAASPHHQRPHVRHRRPRHLIVEFGVLLFRSRGDVHRRCAVSAGREDLLRRTGDGWQLARRTIMVDDSVIRMQNLAIFL